MGWLVYEASVQCLFLSKARACIGHATLYICRAHKLEVLWWELLLGGVSEEALVQAQADPMTLVHTVNHSS